MVNDRNTDVATTEEGNQLQRVQPTHFLTPFDEMERVMDRMLGTFYPGSWPRSLLWDRPFIGELARPYDIKLPRVDVIDRDEEIVVRAEVPGVDKKDLEISVTEDAVTITGKTILEEKEEKGSYCRCEVTRGTFSRTVGLPGDVDADKAKTFFKDGMLELTLPKVAKSKRHTIKLD